MSLVQQPEWINTLGYSPLLRYSVLASLLSEYVPDGVGISPTTLHFTKNTNQQMLADSMAMEGDCKAAQNGEQCHARFLGVWSRVCVVPFRSGAHDLQPPAPV